MIFWNILVSNKVRIEITQWADLADDLDDILNDIIEHFEEGKADED